MSLPTEESIYCFDCQGYNIPETYCLCKSCYDKRARSIKQESIKEILDIIDKAMMQNSKWYKEAKDETNYDLCTKLDARLFELQELKQKLMELKANKK